MKALVAILSIYFLASCINTVSKRVGYEKVFDGLVDEICFTNESKEVEDNHGYDFLVTVNPLEQHNRLVGFKIDINGQGSKGGIDDFYKSAGKVSNSFLEAVEQKCTSS